MLELKDISVRLEGVQILNAVSLNILPGEIVGVVGKNGAGKSTLAKVAYGGLTEFTGTVVYNGHDLKHISKKALSQERAVLSQNFEPVWDFSVVDYLLMARYAHRPLSRRDYEAVDELCEQFSIGHFLERPVKTLSGGEQQRVHFVKALLQIYPFKTASYLFLDEPTASLDLEQQQMLLQSVSRLAKIEGIGVFLVIHDLNQAAMYCDRLCVLQHGRASRVGRPVEVLTSETLNSCFGVKADIFYNEERRVPVLTI